MARAHTLSRARMVLVLRSSTRSCPSSTIRAHRFMASCGSFDGSRSFFARPARFSFCDLPPLCPDLLPSYPDIASARRPRRQQLCTAPGPHEQAEQGWWPSVNLRVAACLSVQPQRLKAQTRSGSGAWPVTGWHTNAGGGWSCGGQLNAFVDDMHGEEGTDTSTHSKSNGRPKDCIDPRA